MGTTQQNDDDLIILTDDVQTESNDEMVINLDSEDKPTEDDVILTFDDAEEVSQDKKSPTDEITLVDEDPFVMTEEINTSESTVMKSEEGTTSNNIDLDFGSLNLGENQEIETKEDTFKNQESSTEDTFDFGLLNTEETNSEILKEVIPQETSNIDMDLSFWNLEEKTQEVLSEKENIEEVIPDDNISFGTETEEQSEEVISTESTIWTMESILDDTIAKLSKRQDVIHTEEEKQVLAISHLEEEIKQLESEKSEAEDKKTELEAEDKKIKTNITQLDKMKSAAEVKPTPKAKK